MSITTGGMREIYEAVKNDELDCAIISYQSALCQNMHWVGLRDDPLLAILPADFQLDGGAFPVELFDGREFLMPSDDFELDIMPALTAAGTRVNPEFRYTGLDDAAIVSMVAHGLGVSILSELVMEGISDRVVSIPVEPAASRRLGIVVSEHLQSDRSIKSFVRCAQKAPWQGAELIFSLPLLTNAGTDEAARTGKQNLFHGTCSFLEKV